MIRLCFCNLGLGLGNVKVRPRTYWVFKGGRAEFKQKDPGDGFDCEAHQTPTCLLLDGKLVAYLNPLNGEWVVNVDGKQMCADRLRVDDKEYTLEGRAWEGAGHEAPCIYCGETRKHINDGGTAWCCSTLVGDGKVRTYLHCNRPECGKDVWCCAPCSVDVIGDHCHECKKPRGEVDRELPQYEAWR